LKNNRIQYLACSFLLIFCALPAALAQTADQPSIENQRATLERLRKSVAEIAEQLDAQRVKQSRLQKNIKKQDLKLAATAKESFALNQQAASLDKKRRELDVRQGQLKSSIDGQRQAIAAQVVAAYHLREHNQIAQWLSQKNPVAARRKIEALGFVSENTNKQLIAFENNLLEFAGVVEALEKNQASVAANLKDIASKETKLRQQRNKRLELLAALQIRMAKNEKRHAKSVSEENELDDLITSLEMNAEIQAQKVLLKSAVVTPTNFSAGKASGFKGTFSDAKGKLYWPTQGKKIITFGKRKPDSSSRSQGVTIATEEGSVVYSVFSGVVIFADYLPAQGMLMIIDHGNGYWSLYGHNESLLRDVGDYVDESQPIATVGASGGIKNASLYFEIRKKGKPTNPAQWCQQG